MSTKLVRKTFYPANREEWLALRKQDLTSTEVAALFGLSPYMSYFELYHRKLSPELADDFEENEHMKWGLRLQDVIAAGIAEDQGWKIRRMSEYKRLVNHRLGASFDHRVISPKPARGVFEIKNVFGMKFKDDWIVDGENIEAPPFIELQEQTQLLVSGEELGYIGALVDGNRPILLTRKPNILVHNAILQRASEFWYRVTNRQEPPPDFNVDCEFISKLYGYAEPGKVIEADAEIIELCRAHKKASLEAKVADDCKSAIKAALLMKIGDAEKVLGVEGEFNSISAGTTKPVEVAAHVKAGYRQVRINWPRGKKELNVSAETTINAPSSAAQH